MPSLRLFSLATAVSAIFSCSANAATGVVIGSTGYYQNARVCLDSNGNGRCDANETFTTSGASGHFNLSGNGQVVAEIGTSATLSGAAVTRPLTFRAPAAANTVVSAISSEVQAVMDGNGSTFDVANAEVAARVGVTARQLLEDPNTESDAGVKTLLTTESSQLQNRVAEAVSEAGRSGNLVKSLRNRLDLDAITNVVVIYAENRSFDNLYGLFPGANGIAAAMENPAHYLQKDRDGTTLTTLPVSWGGLTAAPQDASQPVVTEAASAGMPNAPFQIDTAFGLPHSDITRDMYHRFYNNQMQINGGKNDMFVAWGDSGMPVMGYYDGSKMRMWNLAQQYTLADNFFQAAFGGSFLNHQYLACACAPTYPNANTAVAKHSISAVNADGVTLTLKSTSPTSAIKGIPQFVNDSTLTPADAAGVYYAINTMQPAYQPSGNGADAIKGALFADTTKASTLPPQTQTTIGDLLAGKNIDWAWYSQSWNDTTAIATGKRDFPSVANMPGQVMPVAPDFQFHHQPYNYYQRFDPVTASSERAAHLKDYTDLVAAADAGTLPSVAFYKPQGNTNQHPGYASVSEGDKHMADLIARLQAGPQWNHMLIVVTYDENGGEWDHVAPPKADRWGPGSRIPAIVLSPYAKKGLVDHTLYDTSSILRFLTHRYSLTPLAGLNLRDTAMAANGATKPMGDLTNMLDF